MKNKILYTILTLFFASSQGFAQLSFEFGLGMGSSSRDEVTDLALDQTGNLYVTGVFEDSMDVVDGSGVEFVKSNGWKDIFLGKYSPTGDKLWAFSFGGPGWDRGWSMATDNQGNVYSGGVFGGVVDFDPSPATTNLTSNTAGVWPDGYIAKYSTSGDLLWAKHLLTARDRAASQTATLIAITSMEVDFNGDLVIGGAFWDTVWLAPNAMLVSVSSLRDMFLAKYDASGNLVWGKQMGGASDQQIQSLTTDSQGNIYTTGYFFGTPDFDPAGGGSTLTSFGADDIFLAKYTPAGALDWVKGFGSPAGSNTSPEMGFDVGTDAADNVYVTGRLLGPADFDPGSAMGDITPTTSIAAFTAKYNSQGSYQWSFSFEGGGSHYGKKLSVFPNGDFYLAGEYAAGNASPMDLDPDMTGTEAITSLGGTVDVFVAKYTSNMGFQSGRAIRGLQDAKVGGLAANGTNLTVGGFYSGSMLFNQQSGDLRFSKGDYDMFVLRYGDSSNAIENQLTKGTLNVWSDMTSVLVNADLPQAQDAIVYLRNIQGQTLKEWKFPLTKKVQMNVETAAFPAGCYLIELQTPQGREVRKVIFH